MGGFGFIIVISVILIIVAIVASVMKERKRQRPHEASVQKPPPGMNSQMFDMSVSLGTEVFEEGADRTKVFHVGIAGPVTVPRDPRLIQYVVGAVDMTEPQEPKPLISRVPEMREPDSMVFSFASPAIQLPYRTSVATPWTTICSIPLEALVFPMRGRRMVMFYLTVVWASDHRVLARAQDTVFHYNAKKGYIEWSVDRDKAALLAVQLAVAVSAVNGEFEGRTVDMVKTWMKEQVSMMEEHEKPAAREQLNAAARTAVAASKQPDGIDIDTLCAGLAQLTEPEDRYEYLDLCLRVAAADGKAAAEELKVVDRIAERLGVDMKEYRVMADKIVPVTMHEETDVDRLLGITPEMTPDEIRAHLRAEYRKWNGRVTHAEPGVREQAAKMLDLIAQRRSEVE
jgi:uncharacterized tellurite resistance protein B-like protein